MVDTFSVLKDICLRYIIKRTNYISAGNTYGETSITDELIYLIEEAKPFDSKILHAKRESTTGADIEWWFWDYKYDRGIGLRIQAKRMYKVERSMNGNYEGVNHKVKSTGKKQVDSLFHNSINDGLIPLYFFYNFINERNELAPHLYGDKYNWTYSFASTIMDVLQELIRKGSTDNEKLIVFPKDIIRSKRKYQNLWNGQCIRYISKKHIGYPRLIEVLPKSG